MATTLKKSQGWQSKRTKESRQIEALLRQEFPRTDAYRFNPASIRVRVIDDRFDGKSLVARDSMVEKLLRKLPESIQSQIVRLLTLSPAELTSDMRAQVMNAEFEDPTISAL